MRSILRVAIVGLLTALLLVTAFVAGFAANAYETRVRTASAQTQTNLGVFWEAWNVIKGEYYGTIPGRQQMTHGAIRGMLSGLGDPHTVFVEPEDAKGEESNLLGETGDVGLNIDVRDKLLVIVSPVSGSPAEKAGLRGGDIIIKIGDKDITTDITVQAAKVMLRGTVDSKVTIVVHRIGESTPVSAELTRAKYALSTVTFKVLPNSTLGYVKVMLETSETSNEFAKALDSLRTQRVTGLVLDLRNNPGGLFPNPVLDMAGQFLKNGEVVVYEKYRDGTEKSYAAGSLHGAVDLPTVVLVNNGTASAAEILAGALKDHKRAILIGEPTYGKGSVQSVRQLSDRSALHITVATWYTPTHAEIEGTGLQPDISVPLTDHDTQQAMDPQLDRAVQYLKTGS